MKQLNAGERSALRARAHPMSPVVIIGNNGLTASVLAEIELNLKAHELIKIRVTGADHAERETMRETICASCSCAPVQHIGKILVIYREHPKEDSKPAPRKPRTNEAKPERRPSKKAFGRPTTKRSKSDLKPFGRPTSKRSRSDLARSPRGARR